MVDEPLWILAGGEAALDPRWTLFILRSGSGRQTFGGLRAFCRRFQTMPSKTAKGSSTASAKPRGKGSQPRDDSEDELDVPPQATSSNGQEEAPPTTGK
ncbi:unnamed protein product [Pleuronectes platessa]|uniref:Uncharacterized protein n=1 Tax=Pleuronectes platessa TaxID=8262 RepID=A0A9N7U1P9_PLEPL|nr:unnamed protein product [Pleuronectes platessa]